MFYSCLAPLAAAVEYLPAMLYGRPMDIRKVNILLAVLESGSLLRSAEDLGYTPSGLTYMMNSLEEELGLKVLERGRFGVRLTPEGEEILPLLQECSKSEETLRYRVRAINDRKRDILRIGAYDSIARNWLPALLNDFQAQVGPVGVEMFAANPFSLYEALEKNILDLLFVGSFEKYPHKFTPLVKDYFQAVLPPDFDNKGRDYFPIREFEGQPFFMPSFGLDNHVQDALKKHGVSPALLSTRADDPVIIGMVASGMGLTMLSDLVLKGQEYNVQLKPIRPAEYRSLGLATAVQESALPPLAREFAAFVKKSVPES